MSHPVSLSPDVLREQVARAMHAVDDVAGAPVLPWDAEDTDRAAYYRLADAALTVVRGQAVCCRPGGGVSLTTRRDTPRVPPVPQLSAPSATVGDAPGARGETETTPTGTPGHHP